MYDRVDEWVVSALSEFGGKPLRSVAIGDLDLGSIGGEPEKETESQAREFTDLVARIQDVEGSRQRGTPHPPPDRLAGMPRQRHARISTNLERLLKASGQKLPSMKPVLEINPNHPIVERLKTETDDSRFSDWSHTLFDQATLAEGGQLDDPATFVKRLNTLMLTLAGGPASRIWTPGS
jgi:Molecular chaperone, HSP90 family